MLELYKDFCHKYPIVTIEDPFEQDDWDPCAELTAENICQVAYGVSRRRDENFGLCFSPACALGLVVVQHIVIRSTWTAIIEASAECAALVMFGVLVPVLTHASRAQISVRDP